MTKAAALYAFFSQFGLQAFPSNSVPDSTVFPYATYELTTSGQLDRVVLTASLWYRGDDWAGINAKAEEIAATVKDFYLLDCYNGGIIIRCGTPFAQSMNDPEDDKIKRKVLTFEVLYCTPY